MKRRVKRQWRSAKDQGAIMFALRARAKVISDRGGMQKYYLQLAKRIECGDVEIVERTKS